MNTTISRAPGRVNITPSNRGRGHQLVSNYGNTPAVERERWEFRRLVLGAERHWDTVPRPALGDGDHNRRGSSGILGGINQ